MDLKSLMNTSEEGERAANRAASAAPPTPQAQHQPPPPPHPPHHHSQSAQTPTTPAQGTTSFAFRESAYSHALHASPSGKPSAPQEYHPHQQPGSATYPPPQSPYQTPGPYPGRPQQPTLQTQYNDPRSPGSTSVPAPSPYRQPSAPSGGAMNAGYPFPPSAPTPGSGSDAAASPVQRHQYTPSGQYPPRDSYPHASGQPPTAPGPHSLTPHANGPYPAHHQQQLPPQHPHQQQQQQQMPQTPPIGTPGPGHPFVHQASQSTHSTPTPTSAQSQTQSYGQAFPHGSPVATAHPPPSDQYRQTSQPPTPLGPPLSAGQRQSPAAPMFAQPPSPYQQRVSSSSHLNHSHASPPPPPPPGAQRVSSSYTTNDNRVVDPQRRSQSNSERERSMSVSPKTRVPSLPSSAGGHPPAPAPAAADLEARPVQLNNASTHVMMDAAREQRTSTPAKRKLGDRDLSPRELEKTEGRPPPGQVNGGHVPVPRASAQQPPPAPPQVSRKRRIRHAAVPAWAQTWNSRANLRLNKANFELQKRGPPGINGKPDGPVADRSTNRQESPEAARPGTGPRVKEPAAENPPKHSAEDLLGPWEPCIIGIKPYEEIPKAIADFLFINVVGNPDSGEISNRGIQFEVEAKLGTLIDRDTNARVEKFVATECLLHDTGRIAFESSMTAAQHKGMNDWLNDKVVNTNPQNPDPKVRGRVQVQYKHRRELDRFFELPSNLQGRLPGCVRARIPPKHSVKVRVTYDQKTGKVLQKIVKARVADHHLHMPGCPLDCRISVNLEAAWDGSVDELEQVAISHETKFPDRNKDRLSYTQSHYQIDLTQVTQSVPGPNNTTRAEKEHELEIELAPHTLIEQGKRAMSGQPHRYAELVEGFIDNVRVLARASGEFV